MPLPKSVIKSRLNTFITSNRVFYLTPVEQRRAILRGNQLVDLFYEIREDGFFTGISDSNFNKEFKQFSDVQRAVGLLHNKFINVVQKNGRVYLIGIPKVKGFEISGNEMIMTLFWSYASTGELILRLLKKVIDFYQIDRLISPGKVRVGVLKLVDRLTLNKALSVLELRYNTKAFIDVDVPLRNKISYYDFSFFKGKQQFGIKFYYYDWQEYKKLKRYTLQKIMKLGKQSNILLTSLSLTIAPSFF